MTTEPTIEEMLRDPSGIEQVFCPRCGGVKAVRFNGRQVRVEQTTFIRLGWASDIGCTCPRKAT